MFYVNTDEERQPANGDMGATETEGPLSSDDDDNTFLMEKIDSLKKSICKYSLSKQQLRDENAQLKSRLRKYEETPSKEPSTGDGVDVHLSDAMRTMRGELDRMARDNSVDVLRRNLDIIEESINVQSITNARETSMEGAGPDRHNPSPQTMQRLEYALKVANDKHDAKHGQMVRALTDENEKVKKQFQIIFETQKKKNEEMLKECREKDDALIRLNEKILTRRDLHQKVVNMKADENFALREQIQLINTAREEPTGSEKKALEAKDRIIHMLEERISQLSNLISQDMHQKLKQDESCLENIQAANRSSTILEEFNELYTTHWLTAKDELDDIYSEEGLEEAKTKLLFALLMESREKAQSHLGHYQAVLQDMLLHPLQASLSVSQHQANTPDNTTPKEQLRELDSSKLGGDLHSALLSYMKENQDISGIDEITKVVWQTVSCNPEWTAQGLRELRAGDAVMSYVEQCVSLGWRMIVQRPPMTYAATDVGQAPCRDKHDVYSVCKNHKVMVISSYVLPAVYHKDTCLAKARVFVVTGTE